MKKLVSIIPFPPSASFLMLTTTWLDLAEEREITEEESSSLPISSASNLNSAATHDSNLSSYEPRQSLAEAASHEGGNGHEHPDLTSFRHIPEAELVQRTERSEHTATRPNDLNDPKVSFHLIYWSWEFIIH